ncbi:helix-turn-helix transcriptional regulator [Algoriphagus sp. C2-6-M1]|uniref:helix-turn-helix domain-containing protein n=1 Tax=Algoriphagus persicinus TaxID=3108754 RepID=UPI002B3AC462|nr:helix-turn-helix transcriptional regulator [Algoriphagus sp. C2-6-M1]MEB2780872.1 helix-turn-helix transcriptional regulator [Algoriphagus sp. C2-6-M1]
MAFADRLAFARKQKKISQADLGKLVGTSGYIIGKYQRGENIPLIDVSAKIANSIGVTLDYLVKDGKYGRIDNETLKKMKEIQNLDPEKCHTSSQPSTLSSRLPNSKVSLRCN